MTLQRVQIDVLLEDLEATAWRRHRADPDDPTLSRDIVAQARALLRVAAIDEHLHICDCAQHLLLRIGGEEEHEAAAPQRLRAVQPPHPDDDGILRAVQPTREHVPDLGIALVDDPFDLDAYMPPEPVAGPIAVTMVPAPHAVRVLAPACDAAQDPVRPQPRPPHAAAAREQAAAAERRGEGGADDRELRRGLTAQQLHTLDTMSHFGWKLCFVRRPMFQPPVPVAFDRNRERFVVVEADGSIDDTPDLRIRD